MTQRLAGRRILIVEDEVILAWALQDMLAGYGCTVVGPAAGVADALELIDREPMDAAVLDVNLNREKCYPVADALGRRGVPFVFSTAYSAESIEEEYRHHPSVQKPHSGPELAEALSNLLPTQAPVVFPTAAAAAAAAAGIAFWTWQPSTDALELDGNAQRLLGLPPGPMGLATFLDRVNPDDQARLRAAFAAWRAGVAAQAVSFHLNGPTSPDAAIRLRGAPAKGGGPTAGKRIFGALISPLPGN